MTAIYEEVPDTTDSIWEEVPDATDSIWDEVPEIGIDPQKVLMVVNSDLALSAQMADYYIAARGLNAAHKITKSLGTDDTIVGGTDGINPATFYSNVVLPVANYIDANGIEAVICSASVPNLTFAEPDPTVGVLVATSSVLGAATWIRDNEGGMVRGTALNTIAPTFETMSAGSGWFYEPFDETYGSSTTKVGNNTFLDFRTQAISLPYGRLGLPKVDPLVAAENATDTQRMVDDGVANDGVGKAGGEVHLGYHDRTLPDITGYQSELARQYAFAAGVPTKHYIRSYSVDWPAAPAEDYSFANMNSGSLSETAFGMLGSAIENQAVDAPYKDSYTWVPGSWGFEATSDGHAFMATMLKNGACSVVGATQEPQADGINQTNLLMLHLLKGRSMCETMLFAKTKLPWHMDCWGDPLYAPYKR